MTTNNFRYAVVAESAEGWLAGSESWGRRFLPFTWALFESKEEAEHEVESLRSGKSKDIRNIRVEER